MPKEVQELLPDVVERMQPIPLTPDGTLEIKEPNLVAYAIRAIQEQQKEIEQLGGTTIRSAEENWQWLVIAGLIIWNTMITVIVIRRRV